MLLKDTFKGSGLTGIALEVKWLFCASAGSFYAPDNIKIIVSCGGTLTQQQAIKDIILYESKVANLTGAAVIWQVQHTSVFRRGGAVGGAYL